MTNKVIKQGFNKSKSQKAGLIFPVSRFHRYLKKRFPSSCRFKISIGAAVYAASVLEYLVAEITEQAGNAARIMKVKRINPRHIMLAISQDMEMNQTLKHVILPSTGRPLNLAVKTENGTKSVSKASTGKPTIPVKTKKSTKIKKVTKTKKTQIIKVKSVKKAVKKNSKRQPTSQSKSLEVLNERTLFLGQKLVVVQGDIVEMTADAVVHPTSGGYGFGGQVGSSLSNKGGVDLTNEVNKLRVSKPSLKACEAAVSGAVNIPYKYIIHVNSPSWSNNASSAISNLEKAVNNILDSADQFDIQSIAIPSISSGGGGYPKQVAAETILRTINSYFAGVAKSNIKQIYFVIYDKETLDVYKAELTRLA